MNCNDTDLAGVGIFLASAPGYAGQARLPRIVRPIRNVEIITNKYLRGAEKLRGNWGRIYVNKI